MTHDQPMPSTRRAMLLATLAAAVPGAAAAQGAPPAPLAGTSPGQAAMSQLIARANAGTVGIISGGVDGTYIRFAADLASVLDDADLRVIAIIGNITVIHRMYYTYLETKRLEESQLHLAGESRAVGR